MNIEERLIKIENLLTTICTKLQIASLIVEMPKVEVETPKVEVEMPKVEVEMPKVEVEMPKVEVPTDLVRLLNSSEWPAAVDPALICDITSDQDKEDRAEGILDLIIDIDLENLRFLDFGCGEGHVVNKSKNQNPRMSIGYDINKNEKWNVWEKTPNTLFTDEWSVVESNGPYNVVLIYDVIDHMTCSYPELIKTLGNVKKLLAPNGKVYVRTHPWCSRHATHLYHKLNKAYAHLVFTNEELDALGYKQEQTRKVIHPIAEYEEIFKKSDFNIQGTPSKIRESVEPFFMNKIISDRIKLHYKNSPDMKLRQGAFPMYQLEQQFIDYILF